MYCPYSSLAIANEFLDRAFRERRPVTHMQLQKLVYLAHGWSLAVNGYGLIEDEIEAWDFGPVIRKLYDALSKYGLSPVDKLIRWGDDVPLPQPGARPARAPLDDEERAVVDKVWEEYKGFEAYQLSALTHEQRSPWAQVYEKGKNRVINNDLIWEYFVELATAHT